MSNQFYDQFDELFSLATNALNNYSNSDFLQDYFFKVIESFIYANLINNFFSNLTSSNVKEYGLPSHYITQINSKYEKIREDAKSTIADPFERRLIDPASYNEFKHEIKQNFPEACVLISEIEKQLGFEELEVYLKNKAEELKKTGKPREDFSSSLVTAAVETYIKAKGRYPFDDLDKIISTIAESLPKMSEELTEAVKQHINEPLENRRWLLQWLEARRYYRWQEAFDLFESLIGISQEIGELHKKKISKTLLSTNKAKFAALVSIHVRACRISNEILTLLEAGYPDGAFARWRTLNELAVVSFFLSANNDTISERYLEHETMLKCKLAREYQVAHLRLNYPPIDQKELDKLKNERDRLLKKYSKEFKEDWGWIPRSILSNPSFRALSEHVKLDHLQPFFRWSSAAVHGLSRGLDSLGVMADKQHGTLLCGPSNYGLADPLQNASISLQQITVCLLTLQPDFESLMNLYVMDNFVEEIGEKAVVIQKTIEKEEASKPK